MRISDWSSDVCSSDLLGAGFHVVFGGNLGKAQALPAVIAAAERLQGDPDMRIWLFGSGALFGWLKSEIAQRNLTNVVLGGRMPPTAMPAIYAQADALRSEEHTSELQSLMRISYAVFCLKKKTQPHRTDIPQQ